VSIQRAYKTQLNPTQAQRRAFEAQSDAVRWVWNWALALRNAYYKHTGKHLSGRTIIKQFRAGKRINRWPWLNPANSRAEESALDAQDRAFDRYFMMCRGELAKPKLKRPRKDGKPAGYPTFKSRFRGTVAFAFWGLKQSDIRRGAIRLQGIGWVNLQENGYLPTDAEKINRATVSERAGRWYVSVQVEEPETGEVSTGEPVGVDAGINTLATVSDGREFENVKALRSAQRKLAHLQRELERKPKPEKGERGSKRRERNIEAIARLHKRVADMRSTALHEASAGIVGRGNENDERPAVIGIEDLNVKGMMQNKRLAQALSDAAMSELLRQVGYKAGWCGSAVVKADRWEPSTKTCSQCLAVMHHMTLKDRTFHCTECGFTAPRDLNAALNLKRVAEEYRRRETRVEEQDRGGVFGPVAEAPEKREPCAKTQRDMAAATRKPRRHHPDDRVQLGLSL
jgi:putative transposase